MNHTTFTATEIAKLTAIITGGGFKRAADKAAAVRRFGNVLAERIGSDARAPIILGIADFPSAADYLRAVIAEADRDAEPEAPAEEAPAAEPEAPAEVEAPTPPKAKREGSKQACMMAMLAAPEGATVAEVAEAMGWLPHTTRAAISVKARKAGATLTTEKVEGRGRVYRIAA